MNHLFNKWSVPCALRQVPDNTHRSFRVLVLRLGVNKNLAINFTERAIFLLTPRCWYRCVIGPVAAIMSKVVRAGSVQRIPFVLKVRFFQSKFKLEE